jgi:hypothetical protein
MGLHKVRLTDSSVYRYFYPGVKPSPHETKKYSRPTQLLRHEYSAERTTSAGIGSWARDFRREERLLLVLMG